MAWVSLIIIAGLLWYGQEEGVIRIQAWEPAALLLSAYSAFLAIFGWLLFAPERTSAEESPALFFSGMLTLIPPCFIAYHLMPPSSPLRGWLTIGVFVFGLMSILSPLPAEVFAVPRDRKSYLQPLTDCYLSALDAEEPELDLQSLVPRSYYTLTSPDVAQPPTTYGSTARDPWTDPFYGTGRAMSEVGSARRATYSESRTRSPDVRLDVAPLREPVFREPQRESVRGYQPQPMNPPLPTSLPPVPQFPTQIPTPIPTDSATSGLSRPPMTARSAFAPRESRAPNYRPPSVTPGTAEQVPGSSDPSASTTATGPRRPLTEPGGRATQPVGFQTPAPVSRPVTSSPPPVPSILPPATSRITTPTATPPVTRELPSRQIPPRPIPAVLDSAPGLGLAAISAAAPLASAATMDDVLKSAVAEFRSLADPPLQQLDRRIKELESDDEQDAETDIQSAMSPTARTSALNDVTMERVKDEHGSEMVEGTINVFFEVGQKRAHLHVPFSPPLEGLPEVECEAVSDDSVRCKVAVRQPYGIRIEVRRSDASSALRTDVGFAAVYSPPSDHS